jgi:hypothetical protein
MTGKSAAVLVVTLALSPVSAEPRRPPGPAPAAPLGVVFETALDRAAEKLESAECRLVLTDFRDAAGRSLAENLSNTGLGAPDFLRHLRFRDGRNEDLCHGRHVDAFTTIGGETVWTCPGGSLSLGGENTRAGPDTLIHEMLHALGLPENPPTSLEITHRVVRRCGL